MLYFLWKRAYFKGIELAGRYLDSRNFITEWPCGLLLAVIVCKKCIRNTDRSLHELRTTTPYGPTSQTGIPSKALRDFRFTFKPTEIALNKYEKIVRLTDTTDSDVKEILEKNNLLKECRDYLWVLLFFNY